MKQNLTETHPQIAAEWDYEINGDLLPSDVSKGMTKEVYWKCPNGHSYPARIDHRCSMKSGCPFCAHKKPYLGETDLVTVYPEIAAEWDYEKNDGKPEEYLPFSNKEASWICPVCKKSYLRRIYERTLGGLCCKKCSGTGAKSLASAFPELAKEWDYTLNKRKPDDILADSDTRASWICPICSKSYWRRISERTVGKLGCRYCTHLDEAHTSQQEQAFVYYLSKVTEVQNRAAVHGLEVDVFLPKIHTGIEYQGEYYHQNRAEKDKAKKQALTAEGIRLITVQCGRSRDISDDTITLYSRPMANPSDSELEWGICEVFRLLSLPVPEISIERDRTAIYAQYIRTVKENSLASRYPDIAIEWDYAGNHGLTPEMFSYGVSKKVRWICSKCGYKYPAFISSRIQGHGCPACAGKIVIKGKNDLATLCPNSLFIWDYDKNKGNPSDYCAYTTKKAHWKCDQCGYEWFTSIGSIASGTRCRECAKKKRVVTNRSHMLQRKGSFADEYPELLDEWDYQNNPLPPEQYLSGSDLPANWICRICGNQWSMSVYRRAKMGQGCPKCGREKSDAARHSNILARRGTLADLCPELMSEWDYDKNENGPECYTKGSKEEVFWKCSKGHSWPARIYSRTRAVNPGGCPQCAGRVRCINLDTGEVFENYTAAAKSVGVTRKAITFAIKHGSKCKGFRWAVYET